MSIITVLSEGDAEETDAPERAATKGKQTAVRMVEARCSLGILRVPWAFCVFLRRGLQVCGPRVVHMNL